MPMTPPQEHEFEVFLQEKAGEAQKLGYKPTLFLRMLGTEGAFRTVSTLLSKPNPSLGYENLWQLDRLDLTVEALVVETKWRAFFDPEQIAIAERRLKKSNYQFTPYVDSAGSPNSGAVRGSASASKVLQKRKNSRTFTEFCSALGAPLKNPADRLCGISDERRIAIFNLWADRFTNRTYVLWDHEARVNDNRIGAKELRTVIDKVIAQGYAAYGILAEAVDPTAEQRKRGYFEEDVVLALRLEREPPNVIAYVEGEVPSADLIAGRAPKLEPFNSALDDLAAPPAGTANPERVARTSSGYRRDPAVREYVLLRADGKCEYCGAVGFELDDRSRYVEAHHVLALSANGPDTIENVIALCPSHHREAHYGRNADRLEGDFLEKLRQINEARRVNPHA